MVRLYNDLTKNVETLAAPSPVSLYVCGITPYDTTHLGHAFTYCSFDLLVRFLEWQGKTVRYVQNVTDVDDDILRKAAEAQEDWRSLGNCWVQRFARDMAALNVRPPDCYPRASEAIPNIIALIEILLARGDCYERDGCVYLSARRAGFGRLSRLPPEQWLPVANEHGNHADDPRKADPLDPVLWQAQQPGEPSWPSPWGQGRPGWHIECSALNLGRLGAQIDIHGGGADLVFPHHETEIALAQAVTQREPFARFWLHTGLVCYRGAKMSKSLGNLVLVGDLLRENDADALRLYFATHHYRQPWCHEGSNLAACASRAARWRRLVRAGARPSLHVQETCVGRFTSAMADDLDSPRAVTALEHLADDMERGRASKRHAGSADALAELASVLGLRLDAERPGPGVSVGWARHAARFGALQEEEA